MDSGIPRSWAGGLSWNQSPWIPRGNCTGVFYPSGPETSCSNLGKSFHTALNTGVIFFCILFYLFLYIAGSYQLSILYILVYICQSQSPNSSRHHHPPATAFPPWCPYVCSLHLCLYFCPANRFIFTIFLGSTYMRQYTIFGFLFLTYFTLYDSLQIHPRLYK